MASHKDVCSFKTDTDAACDAFFTGDKAAFVKALEGAKKAAKTLPDAVEYLSLSIENFPDTKTLCFLVRAAEVVWLDAIRKSRFYQ